MDIVFEYLRDPAPQHTSRTQYAESSTARDKRNGGVMQSTLGFRWTLWAFWSGSRWLLGIVLALSLAPGASSVDVVAAFPPAPADLDVQHLAVDPMSGRLYVGARNWIYQLNGASLQQEAAFRTGPEKDSPQCISPEGCESTLHLHSNVNKVLLVDNVGQKLLSCGSLFQGACRAHHLDNISQADPPVYIPVAANDETSSTYAFIGPARYAGQTRALYVSATNSRLGPYRDYVPAIGGRCLDPTRRFSIIETSFTANARVDIASQLRDYYLVHYVYSFASGGFIYFAAIQKRSHLRALEEWGYVTRLGRICADDGSFQTYTEVTLQCGHGYDLLQAASIAHAGDALAQSLGVAPGTEVLVGVFASNRDHTAKPGSNSAVCLFPIPDIEHKFTENIHMCYNGSMVSRDMNYIAGNVEKCPEPGHGGNVISFCKETLMLNGSLPATAPTALTYDNVTLTAALATTTDRHTVLFAGTSRGRIKKILLNGLEQAEEFEEVVLDDDSVLPDLQLDPSQRFLYVPTARNVKKVQLEHCGHYSSCSLCLQARNPYCGWCSLEKKCTVKWACQNATSLHEASSRWLSLNTQQCIDFQDIRPQRLPVTDQALVELEIHQLPQLPYGAHYLCVFGHTEPVQAQVTPRGLACTTPELSARPPIPRGQDHVIVDLAVRSSETNTDFLNHNFAFFDCSLHLTCASCVTSNWACSWCPHENVCTHNSSICRRNVITGERNHEESLIKGRQYCPSFSLHEAILLPHGVKKEIAIEVKNLPSSVDNFKCIVEIEGAKEEVLASIQQNRIVCAETVYRYQEEVGEIQGSLTVVWNEDTYIDRTNVTLYKCNLAGSSGPADCSLCRTRDLRFSCRWCGGTCLYGENCIDPMVPSCPPPRIDWIHPLTGPVEGGTLVTIEGSNLGTSLDEIRDKISIGGIPCIPVEHHISVKVVCRTGASGVHLQADVVVGNNAGVTQAREKFVYKLVQLMDVHPKSGPQSGGTRLYLSGTNLNTGSQLEVFLDELPCAVDRTLASNSQISCRTTPITSPGTSVIRQLSVRIDHALLSLPHPFTYTPDPTIQRIQPLKSFVSGGRSVNVVGTDFRSVLQPRMVVFHNGTSVNETVCEVVSDSRLVCPSPAVNSLVESYQGGYSRGGWRLRVGFIMDDVLSVRQLQDHFPSLHSDLLYVPDPVLFPFKDIKLYKGESLVIEGENIQLSITEAEVSVFVGSKVCNVTSLANSQLVCLPPAEQPAGTDEMGRRTASGLPAVVVRFGHSLRFHLGPLQYEVPRRYELPGEAIAGIAAGGTLLVLVSIAILVVLRHKSSQAEREYKRIQLQMDTLENSVRSECKQAFAELQTDMTDLTNDLETTGIPTLDHRTYVMKVFFPGVHDHPLLQESKLHSTGLYTSCDIAMGQFEQLLNIKSFLLTFIRTLEAQRCFSFRDRVNVASLLMVILMEKMEYATDVLRALLLQLVEKSVMSKHPQLMLRRTESVVEKMLTNWLSLSMYDYLKDHAGSSMFLLSCAIKHQVEKGPVDAITHDARYSLSEERLLREQTDYMMVTIHVVQEDQDEKITCRVNDCDTISQVKMKILDAVYKNTPFSQRPSIHDVDLEWRHGRGGHLTLADEDLTTKTLNGGWRRLNTLRHYGIRDSAVMSLIHTAAQHDSFSSNCTGNSVAPIMGGGNNSPTSNGLRYWHLVKPVDDQQNSSSVMSKSVPEIFLTRLLSTKGTVQKFVDDFLGTILSVNQHLPPAIKWLFDLFDEAATRHGITDPEVPHAWKSNSLPLRFWVNFIKNPDFILDIQKSPVVDSCLSVVAQTLMDACSTAEHRLGKDSPSNKLLFARDIPNYRRLVARFYQDIAALPPVTDQEMCVAMQALSLAHAGEFDTVSALRDLYVYAAKYSEALRESLDIDPYCQRLLLSARLDTVACTLQGEETSVC
ncbi:plexB [Cordylochernes scorpioides]|uniref:PlexB n=1 Tax=Cordylochernes scorpioides TaxID=51811 RepID=A0ABY6LCI6_9ARAC|nr:plexB [Cordylochernes scorpioides]